MKKIWTIVSLTFIISLLSFNCFAITGNELSSEPYYLITFQDFTFAADSDVLVNYAVVDIIDDELIYSRINTIGHFNEENGSFTLSYSYMDRYVSFYVVDVGEAFCNVSLTIQDKQQSYSVYRYGSWDLQEIKCYISFPTNYPISSLGDNIYPVNNPSTFVVDQHNYSNTLLYTLTNDYILAIKNCTKILYTDDGITVVGFTLTAVTCMFAIYIIFKKILGCFKW